jgi:hypothetical protein
LKACVSELADAMQATPTSTAMMVVGSGSDAFLPIRVVGEDYVHTTLSTAKVQVPRSLCQSCRDVNSV